MLSDYSILRQLSSWTNGKPVSVDFFYAICKLHENGQYVPSVDVIGVPEACFDLVLPKTIMYTVLRDMKQEESNFQATMSWSSGRTPNHFQMSGNKVDSWHNKLISLRKPEREELKLNLIKVHSKHDVLPLDNDTTLQYIQRHGQRFDTGNYIGNDHPEVVSRNKRKQEKKDAAKWQSKPVSKKAKLSEHELMMSDYDKKMEDVEFTEDADLEEIFDKLSAFDETKFNETEVETLKIINKNNRIARSRQLGDWVTISVDGKKKKSIVIVKDAIGVASAIGLQCWRYCSLMRRCPQIAKHPTKVFHGKWMLNKPSMCSICSTSHHNIMTIFIKSVLRISANTHMSK